MCIQDICFCRFLQAFFSVQLEVDPGFDQAGFLSRCGKLSFVEGLANLSFNEGLFAYTYILYSMCL
jgi:hypothetical protein